LLYNKANRVFHFLIIKLIPFSLQDTPLYLIWGARIQHTQAEQPN